MVAVMANTVAEARHMLTVPEQRLILWLIAQIQREDDALREFTVSVAEFREILGQSVNGSLYHQMEEACDKLQSRVLELRTGPTTRKKFNWMQEVKYLDAEGRIVLQFHQNSQPLLLQLRERFCRVPLRTAFQLRSAYAIRWMEMLYSRQHQGTFYLSIEELRDWLHIEPHELRTSSHLYQRAIDYPRRELDKKSPLNFTCQPRRISLKTCGWDFTVLENKPKPVKPKLKKPRRVKAAAAPAPVIDDAQRAALAAALHDFKVSLAPGHTLPSAS